MSHQISSRLLTLDAMRGLAAIAVIFFHLGSIGSFAPSGYLAVDFFFLMSGIVIAKAYRTRLSEKIRFTDFLLERLIRLYPLFVIGLLVGLVRKIAQIAANLPGQLNWSDLLISFSFNLFMLPSPVTSQISPINGPAWSLIFELLVNIFWAGLLIKASKLVLVVLVFSSGIALIYAIMSTGSADHGTDWVNIHIGFLRSLFGFGLGVLMAQTGLNKGVRDSALSIVAALGLCALLLIDVPHRYRPFYDALAIFCMFPVIAWLGASYNPPDLFKRTSEILGDLSYPVYLLHLAPLFLVSYVARKYGISPAIWIPTFVVGISAVSLYLGRSYDPVARRYLRSMLNRRRQPVVR